MSRSEIELASPYARMAAAALGLLFLARCSARPAAAAWLAGWLAGWLVPAC